MKLKMSGVIYGGMNTTLLQSFIISLIKMFSPQDLSYGSGTPVALTKSESSAGSCSWIDLMLETFSEEKSTSLRETTTTVSYAPITGKKPFFTFIIVAWSIWKQRNNFIFNKVRPAFRVGNQASWMRLDFKLIE
jgi:hypothetical protein